MNVRTRLFTGFALADAILDGLAPKPADALRVMADRSAPGAMAYVTRIVEYAERIGLGTEVVDYPPADGWRAGATEASGRPTLLVQPAPRGFDVSQFLDRIGPEADVEGLHPTHAGRHARGEPAVVPPTAEAAMRVAAELVGSLEGALVCVVGASPTVGRPLALALLSAGATVRIAQATTRDLIAETCDADIVIAAAGVPGLIGRDHLKPGAVAIDVGVTRVEGRLLGDIDRAGAEGRAAWLTHVPDGVGPLTTACLMRNAVRACRRLEQ